MLARRQRRARQRRRCRDAVRRCGRGRRVSFRSRRTRRLPVARALRGVQAGGDAAQVGARAPSAQKLVLDLAGISQEITVSSVAAEVGTNAAGNVDAVSIDQTMLDSLPVFDRDFIATASRFLDTGSLGNGGVTVVVNGMEVNALNVSASAVSQMRINQDPYSAEYSRPGRGRIEILTKPGSQVFHGEINGVFRDARFDARNAFATTEPTEHRRIAEGFLGGPLGRGGKTSFMLSATDERDDSQAFIHAVGPDGLIEDTLPQASARALVTGSITHQFSDRNTFSIRPNYQYESDENRGAGGTTLASAATTFKHHEQQVTFTQQTILRPTLVNQFQMLFGHEREPTTSLTARSRHRRRRRVHRRRRAGGSRPDRDPYQHERKPGVEPRLAFRPGGIPAARLEPPRLLRSQPTSAARSSSPTSMSTRSVGRTRSRSSRGTATSHSSRSWSAPTSRTTGRCGRACRSATACVTTGRTTFTTRTTSRRACRSPSRPATRRRTCSAPAPACSTIAAVRW